MDKHHDNHAWTKTITSHIKYDINLTFRTSTCVGHLYCKNQDCKYTAHIYCTSPMNEMEWNWFTPTTFLARQAAFDGSPLCAKSIKFPQSILQLVVPWFIICLEPLTWLVFACILGFTNILWRLVITRSSRRGRVPSLGNRSKGFPKLIILQSSWKLLRSSWMSSYWILN